MLVILPNPDVTPDPEPNELDDPLEQVKSPRMFEGRDEEPI